MRLATLDAAMRRGLRVADQSSLALGRVELAAAHRSAILGSCVVLPEPVSPQTMTTWCAAIAP
jgi:hypothetical protein